MKKKIVFVANSGFMIYNFRKNLLQSFVLDQFDVVVVVPDSEYDREFDDLGVLVLKYSLNKHTVNPFKNCRDLLSLFVVLRHAQPDLVFSFTIKCNIYCGIIRYFLDFSFVPNVSGLGRVYLSKFLPYLVNRIYAVSFFKADKVFLQNIEGLKLLVDEKVIDKKKCVVLPGSGVDLKKFTNLEMNFSGKPVIKFLYVGRFVTSKGIFDFLEAGLIVSDSNPFVEFHVVGDYDESMASDEDYINKFTRYESSEKIIFHGFKKDVRPNLEQSHCVCLPSYYPEGVPRSLLEALAVGRLVITTDMPGCKETVIDGENGVLLKKRSVSELVDAFTHISSLNENTLKKMGYKSRRLAEGKFSDDVVISQYHDIVSSC